MKIKHLILSILALGGLLVSCKGEKEEDWGAPALNLDKTELSLEQGGSSTTFTVTANRDWAVSPKESWIAVTPQGGQPSKNAQTVTVTVLENTGNDRTGTIEVKLLSGSQALTTKTIKVNQAGPKGEDTTDKPMGTGTKEDPYNAAGAVAFINTLAPDAESEAPVYIKGIVSSVEETYEASGTYGNGKFYISGDGTDKTTQFYAFQVLYLGNKKWAKGQDDIKVGDEVIIYGKVVNYKGNTPETVGKGAAYLYSLNGKVVEEAGGTPAGTGTLADPYNPAGVIAYIQTLGSDKESPNVVYVKGKISSIETTFAASGNYGNATFYISEDGTTASKEFYVFQTYYLGNRQWKTGDTEVKVGDEVIICGKVINYKGNTPETVSKGGSYIYSLNGVVDGGGDTPQPPAEIKEVTISQFLAAEESTTQPYKLTGKVSNIANTTYGNFDLTDATGKVYVYGLVSKDLGGYDANYKNDKSFASIGIKEGDEITIVGYRKIHTNAEGQKTDEVAGSYYVSGASGGGGETPQPTVMDIASMISSADNSAVAAENVFVGAITTKGYVATDGKKSIYVFHNSTPSVAVGDIVKFSGTKATYYDLPEITDPTTTRTSSGTVTYPEPVDITSSFETYSATEAVYVKYTATMFKSGNYTNFKVEGATRSGSFSSAPSVYYDGINEGDSVEIYGYYNGINTSSNLLNVIAVKIVNKTTGKTIPGDGSGGGGEEPQPPVEDGEVKITWDKQTGWTLVTGASGSATYTSGSYTIHALSNGNSNAPTVNASSGDFRSYAKATVTISTTGKAMTKIVFNLSSQGQKRLTEITASVGTVATQAVGDKTVTWTGSAKEVTFTVGEKAVYGSDGESKAGQFDFNDVVITPEK